MRNDKRQTEKEAEEARRRRGMVTHIEPQRNKTNKESKGKKKAGGWNEMTANVEQKLR